MPILGLLLASILAYNLVCAIFHKPGYCHYCELGFVAGCVCLVCLVGSLTCRRKLGAKNFDYNALVYMDLLSYKLPIWSIQVAQSYVQMRSCDYEAKNELNFPHVSIAIHLAFVPTVLYVLNRLATIS